MVKKNKVWLTIKRFHPWSDFRYPLTVGVMLVFACLLVFGVNAVQANAELRHQVSQLQAQGTCRNEKAAAVDVASAQVLAQLVIAVTTPRDSPYDPTKLRQLAVALSEAAEARRLSVSTCLQDPRAATVITASNTSSG